MKYSKTIILLYALTTFLFHLPNNLIAQDKISKLIAKGNYQKAEEYCSKQEGITQIICFKTLGDAYFDDKKYENSVQCYEKSDNKDGFEKLGDIFFDKRDYAKSVSYYEKAYSGSTVKIKESYIKIADAYFATKDYENHITYYEKAYSGDTEKLKENYLKVGNIYYDFEEYEMAGMLYDKGNCKKGLESLGDIYFKRNDIDKAILYFDKAAKLYKKAINGDKPKELYYYGIWTDKTNGQVYKIVSIGTQVWMAENLKTDTYNDGTPIPRANDFNEWAIERGAYCWYQFNSSRYEETYGKLYNWYAVNTGKLCPVSWHVPSNKEWEALEEFLRNNRIVDNDTEEFDHRIGGLLKETGTDHWKKPNGGATNESGFSALPGGTCIPPYWIVTGVSKGKGTSGEWWSSTEGEVSEFSSKPQAFFLTLSKSSAQFWLHEYHIGKGCNIRCIKD